MTSVRPKLKPETPKTITAWNTRTGQTVWMRADGSWSRNPDELGIFTGAGAEQALEAALKQEAEVTDPYFMEVALNGQIAGRETLRERIRANGPTVQFGALSEA